MQSSSVSGPTRRGPVRPSTGSSQSGRTAWVGSRSASTFRRQRGGGGAAATGRGRHVPPLELEPFSEDWLVWYDDRRLCSYIDMLNCNGVFHGIMPPLERRARERAAPGPSSIRLLS